MRETNEHTVGEGVDFIGEAVVFKALEDPRADMDDDGEDEREKEFEKVCRRGLGEDVEEGEYVPAPGEYVLS